MITKTIMKPAQLLAIFLLFSLVRSGAHANSAERLVDIKSADGTVVKATYFAAAKMGPGVLLFCQSNRTRDSWDDLAKQLVAAGINTLAVELQRYKDDKGWWAAEDAALEFLVSQSTVNR